MTVSRTPRPYRFFGRGECARGEARLPERRQGPEGRSVLRRDDRSKKPLWLYADTFKFKVGSAAIVPWSSVNALLMASSSRSGRTRLARGLWRTRVRRPGVDAAVSPRPGCDRCPRRQREARVDPHQQGRAVEQCDSRRPGGAFWCQLEDAHARGVSVVQTRKFSRSPRRARRGGH